MWEKKRYHHGQHLEGMGRRGLRYVPLVFSCYGRANPDTEQSLVLIARQAARSMGVADNGPLLRRSRAAVGVALCRRAAAMVQACLPKLSPYGVQLLYGYAEGGSDV